MEKPSDKKEKDDDLLFFGAGLSKPAPKRDVPASPKGEPVVEDLVAQPPAEISAPPEKKKAVVKAGEKPKAAATKEEKSKRELQDKLRKTFSFEKREESVALEKWTKKRFSESLDSIRADMPASAKLLAAAKRRPILSSLVLMTGFVVLIADLLVLARYLNLTSFDPIGILRGTRSVPAPIWDGRESGLSLLERGVMADGGDAKDELTASAVRGSNQLPANLELAQLPEGLGGILNPDGTKDDKKKLKKVGGVELDADSLASGGDSLKGMDRTQLKKTTADNFTPYGGGGYGAGRGGGKGGDKVASGVYLGPEGSDLGNYAEVSNPALKRDDFLAPDADGEFPPVPEGVHGEELVQAMLGDDLMEELKKYAKEGTWRMRKAEGAKQNVPAISGDALATSYAAGQLLETKRQTDKALKCGTCTNENRINMNRATFFGEKY